MGSPQQIEDHVKQYFKDNDITNEARMNVTIPKFLDSRKKIQFAESDSDSIPKPHSPTEGGMVARWRARNLAKKDAKLLAASQGELMELVMNKKSYDKKFKNFFSDLLFDPRHGTVKVNGERYIFVRGQSISVEFYSRLQEIFPKEQQVNNIYFISFFGLLGKLNIFLFNKQEKAAKFAANFLFDFAKAIAKSDAYHFIEKSNSWNSIALQKILALPTLLGQMGWGNMKINLDGTNLTSLGRDFLLKFSIANSMEASIWANQEGPNQEEEASSSKKTKTDKPQKNSSSAKKKIPSSSSSSSNKEEEEKKKAPVCVMASGYSMGYLNECIGGARQELGSSRRSQKAKSPRDGPKVAVVEVACEALGHSSCEFICAPVDSIEEAVRRYLKENNRTDPSDFDRLHVGWAVKGKQEKKRHWTSLFSS